jgi:oxygen-independent coproporphyrinogen III oxidase
MTQWPDLANLDPELVARYDKRGPRYTSYPTAPHFSPEVDLEELGRRIRGTSAVPEGEVLPVSVYVHVPYCRRKCLYCGCHSEAICSEDQPSEYLDVVLAELALWRRQLGPGRRAAQLALGGGSPATLEAEGLTQLVRALDEAFVPLDDAERSIELDPYRTDESLLDCLLDVGFTKLSFGIQDFEPDVLSKVGRHEDPTTVERLLGHLRGRGFDTVSFDLMVGLPGQTDETWARTLDRVLELGPSRLAIFPYAHVPWMMPHQKALERYVMPDSDQRLGFYAMAHRVLGESGYVPVGIDHFAKADDELIRAAQEHRLHRNFMGYTTRPGLDLVGLGVSAISDLGAAYAQNLKDTEVYRARVETGALALDRGILLDAEDELRRAVIMSLLCNFWVDLDTSSKRFGLDWRTTFADDLKRLQPLVDDGLVERDRLGDEAGHRLTITTVGLAFVRLVCMIFDRYLDHAAKPDTKQRYSRTL